MKRTVTIAELVDDEVRYRLEDNCITCPYVITEKHICHCGLTGNVIDVQCWEHEPLCDCPFPELDDGRRPIRKGITERYHDINESNIAEIMRHIADSK